VVIGGGGLGSVHVLADGLVTAACLHDGVGVLAGGPVRARQLDFPLAGGLLLATGTPVRHRVAGHGVPTHTHTHTHWDELSHITSL